MNSELPELIIHSTDAVALCLQRHILMRDFLLFDRLFIENISSFMDEFQNILPQLNKMVDKDFKALRLLKTQGYIIESYKELGGHLKAPFESVSIETQTTPFKEDFFETLEFVCKKTGFHLKKDKNSSYAFTTDVLFDTLGFMNYNNQTTLIVRYLELNNLLGIPSIISSNKYNGTAIMNSKSNDVLSLILPSYPVPSKDCLWEQVIEFKNDAESIMKLRKFRKLLKNIGNQSNSPKEIIEELETRHFEYVKALNFHKINYKLERLEVLVTSSAEFVPNLLKLKWGDILKIPIQLRKLRVELDEKIANTPGNEIAYLSDTKNIFAKEIK